MLKKLKEDILTGFDILNDNRISITPLNNIVEGHNNKSVFGSGETLKYYWDCKKSNRRTDFNKVRDALNIGICGFAIRTGKYNNILVVDVDIKTTSNPDFINKLHLTNTLTFKTPSGGFHFFFKYTELLNIRTGIFGNIDIITNDKPIFAGIREDGAYIIYNNNKIRNIDDDLILELNEYQPLQTNKQTNKKPSYIDPYKYDISNEDLLYILSHLPKKYLDEYSLWLCLTYVFKRHNMLDIWDEWSKKSEKYDRNKNIRIWDGLNIEKDEKNLNYIIFLVNHYIKKEYENIENGKKYRLFKNINKVFGEYKPLSNENIKNATPITTQYIDDDIYMVDKDIIIQSGTNTGKSYSIRKYLSKLQTTNPQIKILSLSHLISLCDASISSFNIENIELMKYNIKNMFDFDNKNIAFVINSIDKLNISFDIKNYVIILDEIHAILKVLLTADTLNNKRKYILNIFSTLLKNCFQIIAVDGCICDNVLDYIKKLNRPKKYEFYINDYKSYKNKPAFFINDYEKILNLIIDDINNNIDFFICCNTRKEAENLKRTLEPYFKDPEQLKIYTSREGEAIGDVNNEWYLKSVIISPSIIEGVDDNNPKNIYCFVKGNTTINAEQVSQQIARNRRPINTYINICDTPNDRPIFNNIDDLKNYYRTSENAFIGCYADLVDTKASISGGLDIIDNDYSNMFYIIDYNNRLMMSSFEYYLKEILLKKGYTITTDLYYKHIKDKKEYREQQKEKKERQQKADDDAFINYVEYNKANEKFKQNIEGKCEILNIDCYKYNKTLTEAQKETLYSFEEYLIDEEHFNEHLYFRLLIKPIEYIDNDIKRHSKNDFIYKVISHKINDVKTFKTLLKKYFPNIDIYKFEYNEKDIIKTDINMTDDEYYNLKKCNDRSRKEKPTNNIDLLKMLHILAKKIYGDGSISLKRETIRENKKILNYNNICINESYYKKNISLLGGKFGDFDNIDETFKDEYLK